MASVTKKDCEEIAKRTGFTVKEVDYVLQRFRKLTKDSTSDKLDRLKFRDFVTESMEVRDSLLLDRVCKTFDTDNDNTITFGKFADGLKVVLCGTLEEKIRFCFHVYDLNGDGYVSKEEMFQMLNKSMVRTTTDDDTDDVTKDLVDILMKKMDIDRDGRISQKDYKATVESDSLYLEIFGQCLAPDYCVKRWWGDFHST